MQAAATRALFLCSFVLCAALLPRPADAYYVASGSAADNGFGLPVSVSAIVDIGPTGMLTVTLNNLQANLTARNQEISAFKINFKSGLSASIPQQAISGSGQTIKVASGGSYTTTGSSFNTWGIIGSGSVLTIGTVAPASSGSPTDLIIGQPNGSNLYTNANGGIIGDDVVKGTGVFSYNLGAQNASLAIAAVTFIFGTAGAPNYEFTLSPPTTVPEPGTVVLLATALAGLSALRRRR